MTSGQVFARIVAPAYPTADDGFSPFEECPEIGFKHRSARPNAVYAGVRQTFADARLDIDRFGTPEWNPLGQFVQPGGRVFVLCNFVYHRRPLNETREEFQSKCTHASVIRPVIDYALKAVGPTGVVEFGNSPVQSADWESILRDTEAGALVRFYNTHAPGRVHARDLRGYLLRAQFGWVQGRESRDEGVLVDLGSRSLLEEASGNRLYRSMQYDPGRTAEFHRDNSHIYAISRHIASSDLVISVPKLKTHKRVGVTASIKGCVGTITLKACLAHHRKGATADGGDEYPRNGLLRRSVSEFGEWAWGQPDGRLTNLARVADRVATTLINRTGALGGGSWPGNDTCWRMAVDIARCVAHLTPSGQLREDHWRPHLVVTDGVIGGQGDGPLKSDPAPTGWLSFAADPYASDVAACLAMGYDPDRVPMVATVPSLGALPVTRLRRGDVTLSLDGTSITPARLRRVLQHVYRPPPGWSSLVAAPEPSESGLSDAPHFGAPR